MKGSSRFKYLLAAAVGALIAASVALYQGFALSGAAHLNARYLSDGCFVSAILLIGVGALALISTTDFFDIMSYGASCALAMLLPFRSLKGRPSYYDYKVEKAARRGKPQFFLLIVGVGFLAAALVCWRLYYWLG